MPIFTLVALFLFVSFLHRAIEADSFGLAWWIYTILAAPCGYYVYERIEGN